MGKSSRPLAIHVTHSLYSIASELMDNFVAQGYTIVIIPEGTEPDLFLAPYAMRMTTDMLTAMPSALSLAIKGARELRYAPHGTGAVKGKPKVAKDKKPRKGKNSTLKVKAGDGGTPGDAQVHSAPTREDQGVGGTTINEVSHTTNNEGTTQTE